jgi:signal transduction histidine kinase
MARGSILIVDDEESVTYTMQAILEKDGYTVSTATKGVEAVELLRAQTFDILLTDLRLDDLDGLSILAEVRERSPDTVAILLTGYASLESAVKALREGAYDYLFKPCDVEELRATIARGMERRQLRLQLAERVQELEEANRTISRMNVELHGRVEEATAELRQRMEDLARANEEIENLYREAEDRVTELKQLDELKSRFISMASHELKTPLTAVSGFAQMVARRVQRRLDLGRPTKDEWEEEQRANLHQLELLRNQAWKLVRLVDELLDVSRIESGKLDLTLAPVELQRLVDEVVARMQLTANNHQIVTTVEASDATTVMGDEDQLEQVLNNLLSNAIKYAPDGGEIAVTVRSDEASVDVSVKDQGVGIPPAELDDVFGLFYRAPDTNRRKVGGMGLGLYISKEIVTRHGGRIWVESEVGRGSTFHFAVPSAPPARAVTAS